MTTAKEVMKLIKDNDVKYADFRFTDPRGKWQHVTFDISMIEEDTFAEGQMFDGSSIAGWKAIHESDMNLMPDPASAVIDPFFAETTLSLVCDVLEPTTGEPYNRDPRGIAKKAEGYAKGTGVGDTIYFGPEAEFFIFDDVKYSATPYNTGFKLDSVEFPINSDTDYEGGNLGHHIGFKKGYFPVPPQDTVQDMRSEMLGAMARMGVKVEKHHHEVASAQHELGMKFSPMVVMADQLQIYKYCISQVAQMLRQDRHFHAEADLRRQRLGHALPSVDLEGRQAGLRRQQVRGPLRYLPVLHRRHHQARQGHQRLHQSDDELVQAARPRLRGARAARLFGAQPLGLLPHPLHHQPEGQARRGSFPRSARQSLSRLRCDADGRHGRREEQARPRPGDRQGPVRPAAGRAQAESRPSAARCARHWRNSARIAPSSRPAACSTTTSSTATST